MKIHDKWKKEDPRCRRCILILVLTITKTRKLHGTRSPFHQQQNKYNINMGFMPDLFLDEDSTTILCAEKISSLRQLMPREDEHDVEPLNNTEDDENSCSDDSLVALEEGTRACSEQFSSDEQHDESSCSVGSIVSKDEESARSADVPVSIDVEAQTDESPSPVTPLGASTVDSDNAVGRTKAVVGKTVKGAEKVVKDAVKGTKTLAEKTAKGAGEVAKGAGEVAKKTAKEAEVQVKKAKKETEKVVKNTTNEIVNLPHERATSHWLWLVVILLIHTLLPVVLTLPVILLNHSSVNLGLLHNRDFLYGTHTIVETLILTAFVSTCHYAIEVKEIPLQARATAMVVGLVVGKLVLAFIAEAVWSGLRADPVFPIPFSFIVTTVVAVPSAIATLRVMTPKHEEPEQHSKLCKKFKLLYWTLFAYIVSLLVACTWGMVFRLLAGKAWAQVLWSLALILLEFLCKLPLAANLTTRLNPVKWIQLMLVVDLIFAGVQKAVLPYFANWLSVVVGVLGTIVSILWRAYGGPDRFPLFWNTIKETLADSSSGAADKAKEVSAVGIQIARDSVSNIHTSTMSLRILGTGGMGIGRQLDLEMGQIRHEGADDSGSMEETVAREPTTPETVDTVESEISQDVDPLDLRRSFAKMKSKSRSQRDSQLFQRDGKQRTLYHIVDAVASAIIQLVTHFSGLVTSTLIRAAVPLKELTASFQLDDHQFRLSVLYTWVFIVSICLAILGVGYYIAKGLKLGGLRLERVISLVFRESFWFFFFWFAIEQSISIASQLNHFGADFDCGFEWLKCRGPNLMQFPGCVPMEPSV